MFLGCSVKQYLYFSPLHKSRSNLLFVDFEVSLLKIQVIDDLNPLKNLVLQSSVSDFYSIESILAKYVLLVRMGYKFSLTYDNYEI